MELARIELRKPIGTRTSIAVKREANFGDFVDMERKGWLEDGEVKDDCRLQADGFLIWQLCDGITPPEVALLSLADFNAASTMIRPFCSGDGSGTPA